MENIIINRKKLLFCFIFVFGLWFGTAQYIKNSEFFNIIAVKSFNYLTESNYLKSFILLSFINLLIINIAFFSGFNALGLPIILISPFCYGTFTGVVNSWLFVSNKINGVFYSLINIIPFALITSIFIFITCSSSFYFSSKSAKALIFGEATGRGEVKQFLIKHIMISVVILIISFLQTFLIIKLTEKLIIVI